MTEDSLTDLVCNVTLLSGERYLGDIMTGPFISHGLSSLRWSSYNSNIFTETEQNFEWSLQDSNNINKVEDCSRTLLHLEDIISNIESNHLKTSTRFIPLSLSSSSKVERTLKGRGELDCVWVGLSMTHLINQTFSSLVSGSGELLMETPLYLLLLNKQLLESFKSKAEEIAKSSGFKSDNLDYDVMKTYCIKLVPDTTAN